MAISTDQISLHSTFGVANESSVYSESALCCFSRRRCQATARVLSPSPAAGRLGELFRTMATGFSRSPTSQFPPLPSTKSQTDLTRAVSANPSGSAGSAPSYKRAASAPDGQFGNLEMLPSKFVTLTRSEPSLGKISGRVLFGDTVFGLIGIVDESSGDFCIFQTHALSGMEILDRPVQPWGVAESHSLGLTSDVDAQKNRQNKNLAARREERSRLGPEGTSLEVQSLFNAVSKTISCVWKGKIISIHDVVIEPPYRPENCKGSNRVSLARVQKIIAVEWSKIEEAS